MTKIKLTKQELDEFISSKVETTKLEKYVGTTDKNIDDLFKMYESECSKVHVLEILVEKQKDLMDKQNQMIDILKRKTRHFSYLYELQISEDEKNKEISFIERYIKDIENTIGEQSNEYK